MWFDLISNYIWVKIIIKPNHNIFSPSKCNKINKKRRSTKWASNINLLCPNRRMSSFQISSIRSYSRKRPWKLRIHLSTYLQYSSIHYGSPIRIKRGVHHRHIKILDNWRLVSRWTTFWLGRWRSLSCSTSKTRGWRENSTPISCRIRTATAKSSESRSTIKSSTPKRSMSILKVSFW